MFGLLQDIRFALRQLGKRPGFLISATAMLAVAICANSTVFSWIDGTMLHPIPGVRDSANMVSVMRGVWNTSPSPPLSYLDFRDLRDQNHCLTGMLAYNHDWITLTGGAVPERIYIANVSANFFDVLGMHPQLGRFFRPEEETRPDAVPYIVLSHSLWKTRFHTDEGIIGKSIEIARHPVTVIGVAPEGFIGAMPGIAEDAWLTLNPIGSNSGRMTNRSAAFLNVAATLRPGVSRGMATQDLEAIMNRIVAAYPNEHLGVNTISLDPMWRSPFGANGYMASTLPILLAIAGIVLLLTCANVATLTLVRFVLRRRELAIRLSLGANRLRVLRQMLLEGLLVAVSAGALALLLTAGTAKTFAWFIPPNANPIALSGVVDYRVIAGTAGLAMFACLLCTGLPAWRSSRVPVVEVLKDEAACLSGGSHHQRLLGGLVVTQIGLSVALLVSSGLFLQTLRNVSQGDPGFKQDRILTASVGTSIAGYSDDESKIISRKILEQVMLLPGVTIASLTDWVPMSFTRKTMNAYPEGYVPLAHESLEVRRADVSPWYFETLGIPILEGRGFTRGDDEKAPGVAIVDETAAQHYWPGQDALGKKLSFRGNTALVVGLVKATKHQFMNEVPEPTVYLSYFQSPDREMIVQVKTKGEPADMVPAVVRTIQEIDSRLPVFDVRSLRETTQMSRIFAVMQSTFAGMFAVIVLLLASTGIYGVVSYRTHLRTHEIGVRIALGASRGKVLGLVVWQGLRLTMYGLGVGLVLAFGLTRLIAGLLYGVSANDPRTAAGAILLLAAISLLASYLPAQRAARANPLASIREL